MQHQSAYQYQKAIDFHHQLFYGNAAAAVAAMQQHLNIL
jgi:hypothetical protein